MNITFEKIKTFVRMADRDFEDMAASTELELDRLYDLSARAFVALMSDDNLPETNPAKYVRDCVMDLEWLCHGASPLDKICHALKMKEIQEYDNRS